ncbi:hypothetical protein [Azospirillum sp. sgz302134]
MLYLRDIEVDVHVRCRTCGHEGVLPRADMSRRFGPNYPVLSIAPHYRCSKCDSRDTESRPAPPPLTVVGGTHVEETEAVPSFAGPLAALQGLLDAVRGRDEAGEDEVKEAAARAPIDTAPAHEPSPAESDIPLEQLIADGPGGADDGRRPLWEPISLADMAARLQEDDPAADEPATDDLIDQELAPAEPEGLPEGLDEEPEDDLDLSRFDRTLAALRAMVDGDGAGDGKNGGGQDGKDDLRPEPEPVRLQDAGEDEDEDDEEDDGMPPVFSVKSLVRTDFEDDLEEDEEELEDDGAFRDPFGFHDEPPTGEPEDEPSEEEIVAFAIRDPEKRSPRRERPASAEDMPLDKTIAALRDMVQEAAADPEESDSRRVVTPFSRPRPPVFDRFEDEPEPTSRDRGDRDQDDGADSDEPEDAPPSRKSAQEMEMEEALRALRALVEEEDPDEPPPAAVRTTAAVQKVAEAEDEGEGEDEDEPLDLVNMLKNEDPAPPRAEEPTRAEPKAPVPKRDDSASGDSTSDRAEDDHSPLNKTIAALRSMLELDGKRGR